MKMHTIDEKIDFARQDIIDYAKERPEIMSFLKETHENLKAIGVEVEFDNEFILNELLDYSPDGHDWENTMYEVGYYKGLLDSNK